MKHEKFVIYEFTRVISFPPWKQYEADVSSVSPLSERIFAFFLRGYYLSGRGWRLSSFPTFCHGRPGAQFLISDRKIFTALSCHIHHFVIVMRSDGLLLRDWKKIQCLWKFFFFPFPRRQSKKSPIQQAMAKIGITVSPMKENNYRDCNYSCSNIGYTHLISMSVMKEQIHCGGICSGNNDT